MTGFGEQEFLAYSAFDYFLLSLDILRGLPLFHALDIPLLDGWLTHLQLVIHGDDGTTRNMICFGAQLLEDRIISFPAVQTTQLPNHPSPRECVGEGQELPPVTACNVMAARNN